MIWIKSLDGELKIVNIKKCWITFGNLNSFELYTAHYPKTITVNTNYVRVKLLK
jgi:hypothetical protein